MAYSDLSSISLQMFGNFVLGSYVDTGTSASFSSNTNHPYNYFRITSTNQADGTFVYEYTVDPPGIDFFGLGPAIYTKTGQQLGFSDLNDILIMTDQGVGLIDLNGLPAGARTSPLPPVIVPKNGDPLERAAPPTMGLLNDTGASATDGITSDASLHGFAAPGSTISVEALQIIYGNRTGVHATVAASVGTTLADPVTGEYTLQIGRTSIFGPFKAQVSDPDGISSPFSSLSFTLDQTPPILTMFQVSGDKFITAAERGPITVGGTANEPAFGPILVKIDGTVAGQGTIDSSGYWSAVIDGNALFVGTHSVTAQETDLAGNIGGTSFAQIVTGGYKPPTLLLDAITGDNLIASGERGVIAVTGSTQNTDPGSVVHIKLDGTEVATATTAANGGWSATLDGNALFVGQHAVTASTTDFVGNSASAAQTVYGGHANPVFRFYDNSTADHFYTTSVAERDTIIATLPTFSFEGAQWGTPDKSDQTTDVFRFLDTNTHNHFYTTNAAERDAIIQTLPNYQYEGVAFQAYAQASGQDHLTLERFYNPNAGLHHLSSSFAETTQIKLGAAGPGWVDEGPGFTVHVPNGDMILV